MAMVNDIQVMNPVYNKRYMDDGIIGDVELLKKVRDLVRRLAYTSILQNASGLGLTQSAMSHAPLDSIVVEADQVKLVPRSQIQMLGVPLGTDVFVSDFVRKSC